MNRKSAVAPVLEEIPKEPLKEDGKRTMAMLEPIEIGITHCGILWS